MIERTDRLCESPMRAGTFDRSEVQLGAGSDDEIIVGFG